MKNIDLLESILDNVENEKTSLDEDLFAVLENMTSSLEELVKATAIFQETEADEGFKNICSVNMLSQPKGMLSLISNYLETLSSNSLKKTQSSLIWETGSVLLIPLNDDNKNIVNRMVLCVILNCKVNEKHIKYFDLFGSLFNQLIKYKNR